MKEVKKSIGKQEQHRQAVIAAMPDVRELVKKHGITLVSSCIIKLRNFDKAARRAQQLREQADRLEAELTGEKQKIRGVG